MQRPLLFKAIIVAILVLAILIPLNMIRGTIAERQSYRQQAVNAVAESYAGPQTLVGPVLVVPYLAEVQTVRNDENGAPHAVTHNESRQWVYFPKTLQVSGSVNPSVRHKGLFDVRVYELIGKASSRFEITVPTEVSGSRLLRIGTPFVSVGVNDVRGLFRSQLNIDHRSASLQQGPGAGRPGAGIHADLPALAAGQSLTLEVALDFSLGGTERLAIAPIADDNRIDLASSWRHPQFAGRFLPRTPKVGASGFHALWQVSALAANTQNQYLGGAAANSDGLDLIELTLVDPVNLYSQIDRASKYGVLFVVLTFVGFFMFELIKQLRIHPIQYLLVGLALALFFLLLLSLSEHIPFLWAYLAASAGCIGLLGFYLTYVLRSLSRGLGFAAMLTALYGILYGLLISEDNALLLGSFLLFAVLAAIMIITRRIDWYRLSQQSVDAVMAS